MSIKQGILRGGEKLPSVRHARLSKQVSASTIFQAYYLLEAKGLICAKERSGYYVTSTTPPFKQLPTPDTNIVTQSVQVDVSDLVFTILDTIKARNHIPLGSAFPSPLLFPLQKLAQHMASTVKHTDPWVTVSDIGTGDTELRRQIALRYHLDGVQTPLEHIIITNGALEGLNLCLAALTKPGDKVLIESPSFYASLQAIERMGLQAVEVPCHPQHGIDLDALEKAIIQHQPQACWLMTNFQNPTGSLMSDGRKQRLVALMTQYQIPLIEDDVYAELYYADHRPKPAKAFDTEGWVLHCSSFSKCLAPGYRIGWVSAGRFAQAIARVKISSTLATSIPAQRAIAAYLAKGGYDKHLRTLRHQLMMQQIQFSEAITQFFPHDIRLSLPNGGYFLWIKLPNNISGLDVHQRALAHHISIAPGSIFSASHHFKDYIRLNYGHAWTPDTEQALATLGKIIQQLQPA